MSKHRTTAFVVSSNPLQTEAPGDNNTTINPSAPHPWKTKLNRLTWAFFATALLLPNRSPAQGFSLNPGFNQPGNILISRQAAFVL